MGAGVPLTLFVLLGGEINHVVVRSVLCRDPVYGAGVVVGIVLVTCGERCEER